MIKSIFSKITWLNIKNGKIFCQDAIIKNNFQSRSIIKLNNHIWNGGIPNFNNNLKVIIIEIFSLLKYINIETLTVIKKIMEPKDWIKKYFNPTKLG